MFLAEFLNNHRAGRRFIAQYAGKPRPLADTRDHLRRKRRIFGRKMSEIRQNRHARHFPMPGNRIFPRRHFFHTAEFAAPSGQRRRTGNQRRFNAARQLSRLFQPQRLQIWQSQPRIVLRNMQKSICSRVAEFRRIARSANPERIHHQNNRFRHF